MNEMGITLGMYKGKKVYYCAADAMNGHIATTGKSGSGKSVFNQRITLEIVENSGTVLAISMHQTLNPDEVFAPIRKAFFEKANVIDAYYDGISIPLFTPPVDTCPEKSRIDCIGAVTEVLSRTYHLKSRQIATLRGAVAETFDRGLYSEYGIKAIGDILSAMDSTVSANVAEKMFMIFQHNVLKNGSDFIKDNMINIVELAGFDEITQHAVAEMVLSYIWRLAMEGQFKRNPLHVFVDEAQNLSFTKDSALYKMLTEGRKMGINVMLATQFIEKSSNMARLLNQSDLQVFFSPARNEIKETAAVIDVVRCEEWTAKLKSLSVGQFVAVGPLSIDGVTTAGPLVIDSFEKHAEKHATIDN